MIVLKNKEEIELMRQSALLVSKTLTEVAKSFKTWHYLPDYR